METEGQIVGKLKKWRFDRFLPADCRDGLLEDNERLSGRILELESENKELRAYIGGMQTALRAQRRVTFYNEVGK